MASSRPTLHLIQASCGSAAAHSARYKSEWIPVSDVLLRNRLVSIAGKAGKILVRATCSASRNANKGKADKTKERPRRNRDGQNARQDRSATIKGSGRKHSKVDDAHPIRMTPAGNDRRRPAVEEKPWMANSWTIQARIMGAESPSDILACFEACCGELPLAPWGDRLEARPSTALEASCITAAVPHGQLGDVTSDLATHASDLATLELGKATPYAPQNDLATPSSPAPSAFNDVNAATCLHRIAKQTQRLPVAERLVLARSAPMHALVSFSLSGLPRTTGRCLANTAWALAKMGSPSVYVDEFDWIARVASEKMGQFSPQHAANLELSSLFWAIATLGPPAALDSLMDGMDLAFAEEAGPRDPGHAAARSPPQVEATASRGTAATDSRETGAPLPAENRGAGRGVVVPQGLISAAPAAPQTATRAHPLGKPVATTSSRHHGSSDHTHNRAHDSGSVQRDQGSRGGQLQALLGGLSVQNLCNVAWAYAVGQGTGRASFQGLWRERVCRLTREQLGDQVAHEMQLQQVVMTLRLETPELLDTCPLHPEVTSAIEAAWESEKRSKATVSSAQRHLEWLLTGMGEQFVPEYHECDYSLDVALVEKRVALEMDGPSHFTRNTGELLGHSRLKRRLVEAKGWKLVNIDLARWDVMDGTHAQQDYLREAIERCSRQPQ
eukprot:jgi/Mesvir1/16960/Mv15809-RA.2